MSAANVSPTQVPEQYTKLASLCRDMSSMTEVLGLLSWDEQVMMPTGAAESRGRQKAVLAALLHDKVTSVEFLTAIMAAREHEQSLDEYQRAVVRDAHREYRKNVGVPADLERQIAQHEVLSSQAWGTARRDDDFAAFAPSFKQMLHLAREKAVAIDPSAGAYDTMIDTFERGLSAARLQQIFSGIAEPLRNILHRTLEAKRTCDREVHASLRGGSDWNIADQEALCTEICTALGFDFRKGRIDESTHPFTGGAGSSDVRITTRYSTEIPFEGIMGTVHEVGHAMYEQALNDAYEGLPVRKPLSMGVHESQSLFWERMVAQNKGFWEAMLPKIHAHLPHTRNVSADDLFFAVNQVNRSLIRVDADELTYPFHIMLRFDLEQELMEGRLKIDDLPAAWNAGMRELLDIDVPSDRLGCLQDVHWSYGAFGYFPSYSLGAMMAAQLFHHLKTVALPDVEDRISRGEFDGIREWLNREIHQRGSVYPSLDELLKQVTGEPLNPKYFLDYLDKKYSTVYASQ